MIEPFLYALLGAILIGLAITYRWHREHKRGWLIGRHEFRKWHER